MYVFKFGSDLRQNKGTWNGTCFNNQFAGNCTTDMCQVIFQFLQVFKNCKCPRIKKLRLKGRDYGTSQSVKEFAVELRFKVTNMLTNGGLTGIELLCRLGETSIFVYSNKYFQMSSFYFDSPVLPLLVL